MTTLISGWDSITTEVQHAESSRLDYSKLRGPNEFWLKGGTDAEVVIVSDDNAHVVARYEHSVKLGPSSYFNLPCYGDDDCPFCVLAANGGKDSPIKRKALVAYFTVIQVGTFQRRDGSPLVNPVVALPAKAGSLETFSFLRQENGGSLKGMKFRVRRSKSSTAPRIGDNWIPTGKRLSKAEILELNADAKPFNWGDELPNPERSYVEQLLRTRSGATAPSASYGDSAPTAQPAPKAAEKAPWETGQATTEAPAEAAPKAAPTQAEVSGAADEDDFSW